MSSVNQGYQADSSAEALLTNFQRQASRRRTRMKPNAGRPSPSWLKISLRMTAKPQLKTSHEWPLKCSTLFPPTSAMNNIRYHRRVMHPNFPPQFRRRSNWNLGEISPFGVMYFETYEHGIAFAWSSQIGARICVAFRSKVLVKIYTQSKTSLE